MSVWCCDGVCAEIIENQDKKIDNLKDKIKKTRDKLRTLNNQIDKLKNKLKWIDIEYSLPKKKGFYECLDVENNFEYEENKKIMRVFTCEFKDNEWITNVTHWRNITSKNMQ